ncbi:hypothetical protein Q5752_004783 [Cryptotrichosporon argae]
MSRPPGPTQITPLLPRRVLSLSPSPARLSRRRRRRSPPLHLVPALLTSVILALVVFAAWDVSSLGSCYVRPLCRLLGHGEVEMVWRRNAAAYAPWVSLGPGGGKKGLPRGCDVDQVTILHRHAARFPTLSAGKKMRTALHKLADRAVFVPRHHPGLAFLQHADLTMKDWRFEALTDQGRKAAWRSGREAAAIYHKLSAPPFVRSAGGDRVVESAQYWLEGFSGLPFKIRERRALPAPDVMIPECDTCNSTLSVHTCRAYEALDPDPSTTVPPGLLPLLNAPIARLNSALQPRPSLDADDGLRLAEMCAYDSQVAGDEWAGWSRWCGVFTADEWEGIGYVRDAMRWYGVGEGSEYGKTLGAGYVNELLGRLDDSTPVDATTTNRTLDGDPATFPLGGNRVFADFTHDNEMVEILTAMGLLVQHRPLPLDGPPDKRTFVTAEIVPFGARFAVERVACDLGALEPDPDADGDGAGGRGRDGRADYVRVLVNDAVQHVDHVACRASNFAEHGLCDVDAFREAQAWATDGVDWAVCAV